jgi:hypothetical protein
MKKRCMWCGEMHTVGSDIQIQHDGYQKAYGKELRD